MTAKAIKRLQQDLSQLRHARRELEKDKRDLKKDNRELRHDLGALKKDQKELAQARRGLGNHQKALKGERAELAKGNKALDNHVEVKAERLAALADQKALLEADLADGFDPAVKAELDAVIAKSETVTTTFDQKIAADQQLIAKAKNGVDKFQDKIATDRKEIAGERKEIKQDRREVKQERRDVKQGRREVNKDRARVKDRRHEALDHLRPAEYKMGLKQTNRVRKELGLKPVNHVIRPPSFNLNTVKGCAQFLLRSNNVSYWTGLSSGSDRKNMERLANGNAAYVAATGSYVTPKLSLMRALVDMAKHGKIQINALTGGQHSSNSNHYRGTAVDLAIQVGSPGEIAAIANKYGGYRNSETTHIHLDF